jgi:hypothetical protein
MARPEEVEPVRAELVEAYELIQQSLKINLSLCTLLAKKTNIAENSNTIVLALTLRK